MESSWAVARSYPAAATDLKQLSTPGLRPDQPRRRHVPRPNQAELEEGSAYRIEPWGPGRVLSALQIQIRRLYDALAERVEGKTAEKLMDQTLALNFCPFRSQQRWSRLAPYGAPGIDVAGPGLKSGKRPPEACALLLRRRGLGHSSARFAGVCTSDGGSRAFRRAVRRRAFHHRLSAVCSRRCFHGASVVMSAERRLLSARAIVSFASLIVAS